MTTIIKSVFILTLFVLLPGTAVFAWNKMPYDGHDLSKEADNWYHYEQGMRMVEARNWEQANNEFYYYLDHGAMHRRMWGIAYYGLGVMHQKKGNIGLALENYVLAIQEDKHPEVSVADKACMNMGALYLKRKDYKSAIQAYSKAVQKDPRSGLGHYYLGMSYLKNGDITNAEQEAEAAKKLGVPYTALYDDLAEAKNPTKAKSGGDDDKSSGKTRKNNTKKAKKRSDS